MSDTNQQLENSLSAYYPNERFNLVRYCYWLVNKNGAILLTKSHEKNFPTQIFAEIWEPLSDCYYLSSLWDEDHIDMAAGVVAQRTGYQLATTLSCFGMNCLTQTVSYHEGVVHRQTLDGEAGRPFKTVEHEVRVLNLHYYALVPPKQTLSYWSDLDGEVKWCPFEEVATFLDLEQDQTAFNFLNKQSLDQNLSKMQILLLV